MCGIAGIIAGYLWSLQFPIIKKIWTSSFVLVAGGWSAILLAVFYWIVDVKKHQRWTAPFFWIGTNAITIYIAVRMVPMPKIAERIAGGEIKSSLNSLHHGLGDLLIAVIILSMAVLFCRFLHRRGIFLRV